MPKKVLGTDPFARTSFEATKKSRKSSAKGGNAPDKAEKSSPRRVKLLEPSEKSSPESRADERHRATRRARAAKASVEMPKERSAKARRTPEKPSPEPDTKASESAAPHCVDMEDLAETLETGTRGETRLLSRIFRVPLVSRMGKLWGSFQLRNRSEHVDEFGKDPIYSAKLEPLMEWLYQKYWRVQVSGIKNVPDKGKALLVANHSGMLPFDGLMISEAVRLESQLEREVRFLIEDTFITMPFLSPILTRIGAVRASQENAERLLAKDNLVCVFPEGNKGTGKPFKERYRLQRFGRGGFIKLCIRTKAPLVPVAVVGAEETYPIIARLERLAKPIGIPYLAVTPSWPLLGPLGLIPLPSKWKIGFGKPIRFDKYAEADAGNEVLVSKLREDVRERIQKMLDEMLAERKSVWFG